MRDPSWVGAVVTLPHKRSVIPLLDEADEHVAALRACNGIWKTNDGKLVGTNTDWRGVYGSLIAATEEGKEKPAIVIGAGGACRAAVYALAIHLNAPTIYIINRDAQEVADLLKDVTEGYTSAGLVVPSIVHVTSVDEAHSLATPYYIVGTVPDFPPVSPAEITAQDILVAFIQQPEKGVLLDMCYKPRETRHLKLAKEGGWKTVDGVNIIAWQIETQWPLWAGEEKAKQIPADEARAVLYKAALGQGE
ncbi:uncharacterized protein EV420DRAFT_1580887 [Desarmillaria tabescens]|uniref:Shikimate dehydrogenase substrate binding N-terminal domain-containing protein n=1 Tax=Armillaria tabescens TaxID=1929756 RepID=A0AA39JDS1_ARMTA|nr:uncharacterized protein EV420DRAFT_1580887 [Desarmillaria tabescens]KAK0440917.1 hypothetical protein EV420DRAFT_1580887 [Desarmillaria tabescens]